MKYNTNFNAVVASLSHYRFILFVSITCCVEWRDSFIFFSRLKFINNLFWFAIINKLPTETIKSPWDKQKTAAATVLLEFQSKVCKSSHVSMVSHVCQRLLDMFRSGVCVFPGKALKKKTRNPISVLPILVKR